MSNIVEFLIKFKAQNAEVLWIETWRLKNLTEVLTILFGGKKGH